MECHCVLGTWAKSFINITSSNPYDNPEVVTIIIPVLQRGNWGSAKLKRLVFLTGFRAQTL